MNVIQEFYISELQCCLHFDELTKQKFTYNFILTEGDLGSSEESGKDWSELEEEAAMGNFNVFACMKYYRLLDTFK